MKMSSSTIIKCLKSTGLSMVLNNSGVDDWNDKIILGNDFFTLVKKHWFNVMMHTTIAQVEF